MTPRATRTQNMTKIFKMLEKNCKISKKMRVCSDRLLVSSHGGGRGVLGREGVTVGWGGGGNSGGKVNSGGALQPLRTAPSHHEYKSPKQSPKGPTGLI